MILYLAYNIASAKTIFPEQEWALCILDVNLPDGDGIDYGKVIRKQSQVPIIFLTARDMDEDMIRGFNAGADDYVTKPFNVKILCSGYMLYCAVVRKQKKNFIGAVIWR